MTADTTPNTNRGEMTVLAGNSATLPTDAVESLPPREPRARRVEFVHVGSAA